ncbi:MAG: hydroxyacid dehydrogenase [Candidatus Bathyarchaeia archaeon]
MVRILVCDKIHEDGLQILRQADFKVDVKIDLSKNQLLSLINEYDALIVRSRTLITSEIVEKMNRTKIIARAGVGLDNIDVVAAEKKKIEVINAVEAVTESVAEHTLALLLSASRQITVADSALKQGHWTKSRLTGIQLEGKTLGLVGAGRIGGRVAALAKALGMQLIAFDIIQNQSLTKDLGLQWLSLEDVLRKSDVISVHASLTPETQGMIGEREFSMMKDGCIILNVARGGLINEEALLRALKSGKISAAGLDVYQEEPPKNLELVKLQNVVCTPHIAAQTEEAQRSTSIHVAEVIVKNLKRI